MRLLIVALNFAPEPVGAGRYTAELAAWMAEQGHAVRVVTSHPHYPWWSQPAGGLWYRQETLPAPADIVRITRCPTWVPGSSAGLPRVLHGLFFSACATPAVLAAATWKPNAVLAVAPTIAAAPAALACARLVGARAWLHLQDMELETAAVMDQLPKHVIAPARWIQRNLLKAFDGVICPGEEMAQRAKELGANRAITVPNWLDCKRYTPVAPAKKAACRKRLHLPQNETVVLFAGSIGRKQGLKTLIDAARLMQNEPFVFVVCGEGTERQALSRQAKCLPRVRFLPTQSDADFPQLLASADIHMVMQHPNTPGFLLPSKLAALLAVGGPVVACAEKSSELSRIVAQVRGRVCPWGNAAALSRTLRSMAAEPHTPERVETCRSYARAHLDSLRVLARYERLLTKNGQSAENSCIR